MTMTAPTLRELLDVAVDAAYLAGRSTLGHFQTGLRPDLKADNTPVTIADKEAEKILRARILRDFPTHAILGEEEGASEGDADYRWIVDPIDGTKSFVAGVPLYGVLVGVEVRGEPSVGVIYIPALNDMISAATGLGCTWNGRSCRVSDVDRMENALVLTTSVSSCQKRSDAFDQLVSRTRIQRTWGDAFGYAMIATGRAEVMLDPAMNPWDCAPMLPIMREAGGHFSDWSGKATIHGADAVATNAALASPVMEILKSEKKY
ncbi:histidinol phosphate phosphatase [Capsulimonas corticalis]|uniref:Histidinol phosphate phosphatase n=1 Tax=Capsulimonas corticalis TaxID=2219043 RepID=A0A9N7QAW7_9BACT|nr:inositol monophosphatase family protein [Capsulimonas corticalis]BDI30186.1 histidinol phosphate phosphatase [Capsulimonas corticalis]